MNDPGVAYIRCSLGHVILCYRCSAPLVEGRGLMLYATDDDPEGKPTLPYCGSCLPHTVIRSLLEPEETGAA